MVVAFLQKRKDFLVEQQQTRDVIIVGRIATIWAIVMWFAMADQIRLNLTGKPGSWMFSASVVINCILWTYWGFRHRPRLYPPILANVPGIILGLIAAITAWVDFSGVFLGLLAAIKAYF